MIYWKFKIYESVNMVGKMGLCVLAKFNYYLIQVSVSIDICYLILMEPLLHLDHALISHHLVWEDFCLLWILFCPLFTIDCDCVTYYIQYWIFSMNDWMSLPSIVQCLSAMNCWLKCMMLDPYNQTDHPECRTRPDSGLSAITELDPGYITGNWCCSITYISPGLSIPSIAK